MKLAFVTRYDAQDVHKWSGTPYYMSQGLINNGCEIDYIGPLQKKLDFSYKLKNKCKKWLFNQRDRSTYLPSVLQSYADQVEAQLATYQVDAVLSPVMEAIAYVHSDTPLFLWTDAVFASLKAFYPNYFNLSADTVKQANAMVTACLLRCRLAFFSSDWAARAASDLYGISPDKCRVVPFGANLEINHDVNAVKTMIHARDRETIKLLFIGVEWYRKGADIVLNVAKALHAKGKKVELTFVGVTPPAGEVIPNYVTVTGFISKHTPEGRAKITHYLANSHFLFVPSRAEAYGIVFCEANAYGLPSIGSCIGGIPTIIQNHQNGFVFPLDTPIQLYCDTISDLMKNFEKYEALALSSFQKYLARLNWLSATRTVKTMIQEVL